MAFASRLTTFLALCVVIGYAHAATYTVQFQQWFPQYGHIYEAIKHANCSEEYERYLTAEKVHSEIDVLGGGGIFSALTQPVVTCILENTSEFLKGTMTGAQVLLGVMPTVLALLAASTEEVAMLANVGRRPFLALILSLGSPSVYFSRAFEYQNPPRLMDRRSSQHRPYRPARLYQQLFISAAQYLVALAAVTNIAFVSYDLGIRAVSGIASDQIALPILWVVFGALIHCFGALTLRLRIAGHRKLKSAMTEAGKDSEGTTTSVAAWIRHLPKRLGELFDTEFRPCVSPQYQVWIVRFQERRTYLVARWWLSTVTISHIVFGTLLYSSLFFIGPEDAVKVMARFVASVTVCRILLMYELAGLREAYGSDIEDDLKTV